MNPLLLLVLTAVVVLATFGMTVLTRRAGSALRDLRTGLFRVEVLGSEGLLLRRAEQRLAEAQCLAEAVGAGGARRNHG